MGLKLEPGLGLALIAALASAACEREDPSAAREDAPAEARFEPLAPSPGRFLDARGRIGAPIPEGPGWECLEDSHGEAEAAAIAVRCRREDPREFLFFAAKTHRQPRDQRVDPQTVLMSLYRADNEAFFETVEYVRDQPASVAGAQGWEAELVATHARIGEVRKRERLAIVGDRVFAISAEGAPDLWARHAAEIDAWFAGVEFAR